MSPKLSIICLLALAACASAYPSLWAGKVLPEEVDGPLTPENCIKHPSKKQGGHGSPVNDKDISITATEAGQTKAVKELCPGVSYRITVKYPERRRTFLTTSAGSWETANATCPARIYSTKAQQAVEAFNATLTVPCNATDDSNELKVTSAAGPSAAFKQTSLKLAIASLDKCPQTSCTTGNDTMAANGTMADGIAAGNATADNTTDMLAPNATKSTTAAVKAAANATAAKSAAAASSPAGFVAAAAAAMALFAAML